MILIADGGSTKTHWSIINGQLEMGDFYSEGYNPFFVDEDYIVTSLTAALPTDFPKDSVEMVFFYGAGIHDKKKATVLENAFKQVFTNACSLIDHDLLAACRSLLGKGQGFAAILGTGTNSAIYNGNAIVHHVDSAAYILGDEGSGCYIGKRFLASFLRDCLPPEIKDSFSKSYNYMKDDILDQLYTKPLPNRFCASFSEFVGEHIHHPFMFKIVEGAFQDFFTNIVHLYPDYQKYKFNSVGSVGFYFRDILTTISEKNGMQVGTIVKSPMEGLVSFHREIFRKSSQSYSI